MRSEVEVKLSDEKGLSREPAKGADAPGEPHWSALVNQLETLLPWSPTGSCLLTGLRSQFVALESRASPIKAEVTTDDHFRDEATGEYLRCSATGNLCATDTVRVGYICPCPDCRDYRRQRAVAKVASNLRLPTDR